MNGYSLSKDFFEFSFENNDIVRPTHIAVYFWLIDLNNRLNWVDKFNVPSYYAMQSCCISSYNTYKKVLDDLESWGFVEVVKKSKNGSSPLVIRMSKNDKVNEKSLSKSIKSDHQSEVTINKPINIKTKKTKQKKSHVENDDDLFFAFWDSYGKKVDRAKTEKKWHGLSLNIRQKVLSLLPFYLIDTPEIKYRKNPLTFLNGETWKDYEDRIKEIEIKNKIENEYSEDEKSELQKRKRHYEISTSPIYNGMNKPGDIISFPDYLSNYFAKSGLADTKK